MKHRKRLGKIDRILNDPPIEIDDELALKAIREVFESEVRSKEIVRLKRLNDPLRPLITDADTNVLYLSGKLPERYPAFSGTFERILKERQVACHYLQNTLDVWCRDYMPVQLDKYNLMQFYYNPYYLKYKKYQGTHTIGTDVLPDDIMLSDECDIVLDGGNVISCGDKVIVSEAIFRDNPDRDPKVLVLELEEIFRHPLIIIPYMPGDFTGHADGMVRFYKKGTVLINDNSDLVSVRSKRIAKRLLAILREADFNCVAVPYYPNENNNYTSAYGCYINFLRVGETVFLPFFGNNAQDEWAFKCFMDLFPEVIPLNSREIAASGGVLNCISWTLKNNYEQDR